MSDHATYGEKMSGCLCACLLFYCSQRTNEIFKDQWVNQCRSFETPSRRGEINIAWE